MLQTIEGTYENGRVDLAERPRDVGRVRVIVTFLPPENIAESNTTSAIPPQFTTAELRGKFAAWSEV
ncbi:MAG: hypothetical protein NTZ32_24825 [Planctomycetales bacterium]|nr:hypothetical protein [Planctomycetales bacterium]